MNATPSKLLRWDKGRIDQYYTVSGELIYPIYDELMFHKHGNMIIFNDTIEKLYNGVVNALLSASNLCIKRIPPKSLKFWWNSELNELKMKSMTSHILWIDAGKPKTGYIF